MKAREFIKEVDPIQIQQGPDISPELRRYKERGTLDTFGSDREFGVQDIVGGGASRIAKTTPTTPGTDPGFQRSMGKITKEFDPVHHQRLYREYEKNPQYFIPPPKSGEDTYHHANSMAQFVMNRFPNADIGTLKNIVTGLSTISAKQALRAKQNRDQ
jgi:hypothetical protein